MSETKQSAGQELNERDEHEWIAAQISALKSGQMNRLDRENLIAFLSEMTSATGVNSGLGSPCCCYIC